MNTLTTNEKPSKIVGSSNYASSRVNIFREPIERISKASPANVQEIAASQIELLTVYHNLVLDQSRRSFFWAITAAAVGLIFFIAAVTFALLGNSNSAPVISTICGSLIEFISAINFYLYNKASAQLEKFQTRLDITQRYLIANSICESLEGEYKQRTRAELIKTISPIEAIETGQLIQKDT